MQSAHPSAPEITPLPRPASPEELARRAAAREHRAQVKARAAERGVNVRQNVNWVPPESLVDRLHRYRDLGHDYGATRTQPGWAGLPDAPLPWEKQPEETPRAFGAFRVYRDLGPARRLLETHRRFLNEPAAEVVNRTIDNWSMKFLWAQRAAAFDIYTDAQRWREAQSTYVEELREMAVRQARAAVFLQSKGVQALQQLDPAKLSANELLAYIIRASELERIARGLPRELEDHAKNEIAVRFVDDWRGANERRGVLPPTIAAARAARGPGVGAPTPQALHVPGSGPSLAQDDAGDGADDLRVPGWEDDSVDRADV